MDRNTLENRAFSTVQDSYVLVGKTNSEGHETPDSQFCLNFIAVPTRGPYGAPIGEPVDLQVAVTVPQMAALVKAFFYDLVIAGGIYPKLLRRLLQRRYAVMTSPIYKSPELDVDGYTALRYHTNPRK